MGTKAIGIEKVASGSTGTGGGASAPPGGSAGNDAETPNEEPELEPSDDEVWKLVLTDQLRARAAPARPFTSRRGVVELFEPRKK